MSDGLTNERGGRILLPISLGFFHRNREAFLKQKWPKGSKTVIRKKLYFMVYMLTSFFSTRWPMPSWCRRCARRRRRPLSFNITTWRVRGCLLVSTCWQRTTFSRRLISLQGGKENNPPLPPSPPPMSDISHCIPYCKLSELGSIVVCLNAFLATHFLIKILFPWTFFGTI